MDQKQVQQSLDRAIKRLFDMDVYLLEKDVNERSISHRLAMYLQGEFTTYHVDCEYNRNMDDPKYLDLSPHSISIRDTDAVTAYPDIIVHKRGSNTQNILVIEIKKSTDRRGNSFDLKKLNAFRNPPYNYLFATYICFQTGTNPKLAEIQWL